MLNSYLINVLLIHWFEFVINNKVIGMKQRMKGLYGIVLLSLMVLASCSKNETVTPDTPEKSMVVPAAFAWKTTRQVAINVQSGDEVANGLLYKVSLYQSDPNSGGVPLYSGALGYGYPYSVKLDLPVTTTSLYIKIQYPSGGQTVVNQPITNDMLTYTVTTSPLASMKKSAMAVSGPDCSTGCDNIISGTGSATITGGKTYCITGSFNGSLTFEFWNGGGTVRICGNATITSATLGTNCNIIVAEGGTLNGQNIGMNDNSTIVAWQNSTVIFTSLNMNSANSSITNYSNGMSFTDGFSPNGSLNNFGIIKVAKNFATGNHAGSVSNSGSLLVSGGIDLNQPVTNNGTIEANDKINVNVGNNYVNNCKIISHSDINFNNGTFVCNNGLILADNNIQINGSFSLTLQNQSMMKSKTLTLNTGIAGSGSLNSVITTESGTIHGNSMVSGAIEWADANGTLVNGSAANFSNGATYVKLANATNYIPVTACNPEGIGTPKINDRDGDGVADNLDDYPSDPDRAFNNYFPANGGYATYAFEDLWPSVGDYDFNDLVVNAHLNYVTNAKNMVVEIIGKYYVAAVGGSFTSGFALQFDKLLPGDIKSVKRSNTLSQGYVSQNGNGTENGPEKAVVFLWDNTESMIHRAGGSTFNAITGNPVGKSDTLNITIAFATPKTVAEVGSMPLNHFLVREMNRKIEIHLPNMLPTSMASKDLFGTSDDKSNASNGKYYVTANNLPWGLYIPQEFSYPNEKVNILDAYTKFKAWAESGGTSFADWYQNAQYRDNSFIYHK